MVIYSCGPNYQPCIVYEDNGPLSNKNSVYHYLEPDVVSLIPRPFEVQCGRVFSMTGVFAIEWLT